MLLVSHSLSGVHRIVVNRNSFIGRETLRNIVFVQLISMIHVCTRSKIYPQKVKTNKEIKKTSSIKNLLNQKF
jgi:hypothetical protein